MLKSDYMVVLTSHEVLVFQYTGRLFNIVIHSHASPFEPKKYALCLYAVLKKDLDNKPTSMIKPNASISKSLDMYYEHTPLPNYSSSL